MNFNKLENKKNKNGNIIIIVGILLILGVCLLTLFRSPNKSNQTTAPDSSQSQVSNSNLISADILQKKIKAKENLFIIDIRDANDFLYEHIQDSISIPFSQLATSNFQDNGKTFILVDYSDSAQDFQAIQILKNKNIKNIFVLSGGMATWKQNQQDVISYGDPNLLTDQAKITYITPQDLKNLVESNYPPFIIDVRNAQSFSEGRIPKANNIFLDDLEGMKSKIPGDQPIVVYGVNDLDGFQAGVRLYDLSFYSVKVLQGGISDWQVKEFQIEK